VTNPLGVACKQNIGPYNIDLVRDLSKKGAGGMYAVGLNGLDTDIALPHSHFSC
jgi:hypothetical protein